MLLDSTITHINKTSVEDEREYDAIKEEENKSRRENLAFEDQGFEDDAEEVSEESVEMDFEEEQ